MKITEEEQLKEIFLKSDKQMIWNPDEGTARIITSITKRSDENGLCANFSNGEYVSLDGCEVGDFAIVHRLISQ